MHECAQVGTKGTELTIMSEVKIAQDGVAICHPDGHGSWIGVVAAVVFLNELVLDLRRDLKQVAQARTDATFGLSPVLEEDLVNVVDLVEPADPQPEVVIVAARRRSSNRPTSIRHFLRTRADENGMIMSSRTGRGRDPGKGAFLQARSDMPAIAPPDHKAVGVNQGRRGIAVAALDLFAQLSWPPAVVAVQEGDKLAACFDDAPVLGLPTALGSLAGCSEFDLDRLRPPPGCDRSTHRR